MVTVLGLLGIGFVLNHQDTRLHYSELHAHVVDENGRSRKLSDDIHKVEKKLSDDIHTVEKKLSTMGRSETASRDL